MTCKPTAKETRRRGMRAEVRRQKEEFWTTENAENAENAEDRNAAKAAIAGRCDRRKAESMARRTRTLKETAETSELELARVVARPVTKTLDVPLSEAALREKLHVMTGIRSDIEQIEMDRAKDMGVYKERLKDKDEALNALLDELGQGCTYVDVQCERRFDYANGRVILVRLDTGEELENREMSGDEAQMEFDGLPPQAALDAICATTLDGDVGESTGAAGNKKDLSEENLLTFPGHGGVCGVCRADGSLEKFPGWADETRTLCRACEKDMNKGKAKAPHCVKCGASAKEVVDDLGGWGSFVPAVCWQCSAKE